MSAFAALAEPHRRQIVDLLGERARSVGELVATLGLSQPGTSKHLRVLLDAGLVEVRQDAQRRIYHLNYGPLRELDEWLGPHRTMWEGALDRLEHHLATRAGGPTAAEEPPPTEVGDGPRPRSRREEGARR